MQARIALFLKHAPAPLLCFAGGLLVQPLWTASVIGERLWTLPPGPRLVALLAFGALPILTMVLLLARSIMALATVIVMAALQGYLLFASPSALAELPAAAKAVGIGAMAMVAAGILVLTRKDILYPFLYTHREAWRRARRLRLSLPIELRLADDLETTIRAIVQDVSTGGICVVIRTPPAGTPADGAWRSGQRLRLAASSGLGATTSEALVAEGIVAWVRNAEDMCLLGVSVEGSAFIEALKSAAIQRMSSPLARRRLSFALSFERRSTQAGLAVFWCLTIAGTTAAPACGTEHRTLRVDEDSAPVAETTPAAGETATAGIQTASTSTQPASTTSAAPQTTPSVGAAGSASGEATSVQAAVVNDEALQKLGLIGSLAAMIDRVIEVKAEPGCFAVDVPADTEQEQIAAIPASGDPYRLPTLVPLNGAHGGGYVYELLEQKALTTAATAPLAVFCNARDAEGALWRARLPLAAFGVRQIEDADLLFQIELVRPAADQAPSRATYTFVAPLDERADATAYRALLATATQTILYEAVRTNFPALKLVSYTVVIDGGDLASEASLTLVATAAPRAGALPARRRPPQFGAVAGTTEAPLSLVDTLTFITVDPLERTARSYTDALDGWRGAHPDQDAVALVARLTAAAAPHFFEGMPPPNNEVGGLFFVAEGTPSEQAALAAGFDAALATNSGLKLAEDESTPTAGGLTFASPAGANGAPGPDGGITGAIAATTAGVVSRPAKAAAAFAETVKRSSGAAAPNPPAIAPSPTPAPPPAPAPTPTPNPPGVGPGPSNGAPIAPLILPPAPVYTDVATCKAPIGAAISTIDWLGGSLTVSWINATAAGQQHLIVAELNPQTGEYELAYDKVLGFRSRSTVSHPATSYQSPDYTFAKGIGVSQKKFAVAIANVMPCECSVDSVTLLPHTTSLRFETNPDDDKLQPFLLKTGAAGAATNWSQTRPWARVSEVVYFDAGTVPGGKGLAYRVYNSGLPSTFLWNEKPVRDQGASASTPASFGGRARSVQGGAAPGMADVQFSAGGDLGGGAYVLSSNSLGVACITRANGHCSLTLNTKFDAPDATCYGEWVAGVERQHQPTPPATLDARWWPWLQSQFRQGCASEKEVSVDSYEEVRGDKKVPYLKLSAKFCPTYGHGNIWTISQPGTTGDYTFIDIVGTHCWEADEVDEYERNTGPYTLVNSGIDVESIAEWYRSRTIDPSYSGCLIHKSRNDWYTMSLFGTRYIYLPRFQCPKFCPGLECNTLGSPTALLEDFTLYRTQGHRGGTYTFSNQWGTWKRHRISGETGAEELIDEGSYGPVPPEFQ